MTQGFVQLNPDVDATGKPLDNDVVTIPAGTVVSDQFGNLTTLATPAYYFRERVVSADPLDPRGVANVRNDVNGLETDYGLNVRSPIGGIVDLQTIASLLQDIDANIQTLAQVAQQQPASAANYAFPVTGIDQGVAQPGLPRKLTSDIFGRLLTVPYASREALTYATLTITSTTATNGFIFPPASVYADIYAIVATNTSATATEVDISDGTQIIPLYVPAGDMRGLSLGGPLIRATTPGGNWFATTLTSVASVKLWAAYVQNRTT